MLLLTDGTVMCQNSDSNQWWKLKPDIAGSYVNGTWSALANGPNSPLYFASAVLRDGRVFVAGGEYNAGVSTDLLAAEIYNPVTNTWTAIATPPGWTHIGDAPSCVFPDGRIMIGSIMANQCAIYDPV
ncbi:MAG TPA: kelch repeat-containing protein, partial [Xanthobacteraceae bacterium]